MISFVLPTRDRPAVLARTIAAIDALPREAVGQAGGMEVIVADNASSAPARIPATLSNGASARVLRLSENLGAAARNLAAQDAQGSWLIMLDDDSHPLDAAFVDVIADADADVAAIGAEIVLPGGRHEAGGLPEVFIGCGVAIRREAFLEAGGYDPSFHFYAEEYDLAAKLLLRRWRIEHDFRFRVRHEKHAAGRNMSLITRRLVRNNALIARRYAPDHEVERETREVIARYARMAVNERSGDGFAAGLAELWPMLERQARTPMDEECWDRFTGLAAARIGLGSAQELRARPGVAVVDQGKNAWAIQKALIEAGCEIVPEEAAGAMVVGTLSPGPMIDAWMGRLQRDQAAILPWRPRGVDARHVVALGA